MLLPRRGLIAASLGLAAPAFSSAGAQEAYPSRPVNVIVPWGPGGPTDAFARVLSQRLATDLGQPFLVDNRVGANGTIGMAFAARARPETISYGTSGVGSIGHLAGLIFEQATGARLLHIPFRGASEAEVAVLGGEPTSIVNTLGAHGGAVRQGGLRGLAVTSAERMPSFANIPTLVEAGLPGAVVTNWFLLAGPASMPAEHASRINAVCQAAMAEPAIVERFAQMGLVSLGNLSGAQIRDFVAAEATRWAPLVRQAGITG